ncbi:MAG TPA: ABC transporter substrate-binding protein [Xanthobacteraceae bacterium]|jgi:putative ABC transport system substrate-binding protein
MRRRDFIEAIAGSAAFWPALVASAQEPGRTYHLGALYPSPREAPQVVAIFEELRQSGFIESRNLMIDWRVYGSRVELLSKFAAELVKAKIDVVLAGGDAAIRAAQAATATIPILGFTDDMVGSGLVSSLAKPGGNTTGVSLLATELDGKRQEILIEVVPGLRRMAALADSNTTAPRQLQALQDAARARGVELSIYRVAKPDEIAPAIDAARTSDAAALNVLASPLLFSNRQAIIERAAALRLPAMYQWPETAEEGGLVGYGPRLVQLTRDAMARQLVKLLRGAKPADLPIEQPTKFELVINLRTAKAIGHEVPVALVLRADKIIE